MYKVEIFMDDAITLAEATFAKRSECATFCKEIADDQGLLIDLKTFAQVDYFTEENITFSVSEAD